MRKVYSSVDMFVIAGAAFAFGFCLCWVTFA
jgi:hypothetical protein